VKSILDRLSFARGERDNAANIALAEDIVRTRDTNAIRELVEHLQEKNKRLQSDAIKTLYEIGEREPALIADYADEFAAQLTSKNQRDVWGAVTALDMVARANPSGIHAHLKSILTAASGESVIARDHVVQILAKLCAAGYEAECFPLLLNIMKTAPINQLPSYCEAAAVVVPKDRRASLVKLIEKRLREVREFKPKKTRMEKVLQTLHSA